MAALFFSYKNLNIIFVHTALKSDAKFVSLYIEKNSVIWYN